MKKKLLVLPLIVVLISGCGRKNTSSLVESSISPIQSSSIINSESSFSSSVGTSEVNSTISSYGSINNESSTISSTNSLSSELSSNSSSEAINNYSIEEIKSLALALDNKTSEVDVYESDTKVSINLRLVSTFDMITTKKGYGERYKLVMTDGNDLITVKVNQKVYEFAKTRIGLTFKTNGTISLYCGNPEITCTSNSLETVDSNISSFNNFVSSSIENAYKSLEKVNLNCKGCNIGEPISIKAKYIAKMDDSVCLFYDGKNIISVHGNSSIAKNFTLNKVYTLSGILNMFNFKPGLEYICSTINNDVIISEINKDELVSLDTSIYNIKYETDKNKTYPDYTSTFGTLRKVEGFINYYTKDGKYYTVIEFKNNDNTYRTYENARDAKCLFLKNESAVRLNSTKDIESNPFDNYFTGEKVSLVVAPYLYNSLKYWQVYGLEDSISVINEL